MIVRSADNYSPVLLIRYSGAAELGWRQWNLYEQLLSGSTYCGISPIPIAMARTITGYAADIGSLH